MFWKDVRRWSEHFGFRFRFTQKLQYEGCLIIQNGDSQ